jgi:hypothetical protein
MSGYHALTNLEIINLQKCLEKPRFGYPHYLPLIIDNIIVQECFDQKLLKGEIFYEKIIPRKNGDTTISVSNYGRILYQDEIIKPYVVGIFLHCLKIYHRDFGNQNIYNLMKETIDPIENRYNYQIHHINNNALDNRVV